MSERLQNKMYNYEVTPPTEVWGKIAAALDESEMTHEFPSKLYEIEIAPPTGAWNKISSSLNEEETALPAKKKVFPVIRYAVAAAMIGVIAFGGIQLIKGKSSNKELVHQEKKINIKDTTTPITTPDENSATAEEKNDNTALEEGKQTLASLDIPARKKIKNAAKNYFIQQALNSDQTLNESGYATTALANDQTNNNLEARYIAVITPDCNVVRVSKKLDHLVCCVAGEDPGTVCKDQLQKWREKIACAPINASPGNFMDIVSLVSSLQENDN